MEETSCSGKIVLLSTGDPEGIPVPFCSCEVCSQGRICRLRSSVWVQSQGKTLSLIQVQILEHSYCDTVFLVWMVYFLLILIMIILEGSMISVLGISRI